MALSINIKAVTTALSKPINWVMLGLGFSAGLPFLLVGATLGFWMRESGISLTLIAFTSWVSFVYGLKFVWAPVLDKLKIPILSARLGQRRATMIVAQLGVAIGLLAMAQIGPSNDLRWFALSALWVAFFAASQEIAIDAWRVEQTHSRSDEALNPTLYAYGFKLAILVTNALILVLAKRIGWPLSYVAIAGCMGLGIVTVLCAPKTDQDKVSASQNRDFKAVFITPLVDFFTLHKGKALLILACLMFYRLPDYLIGPVVGPMYNDTGLDNDAIAAMRASVGLWASVLGIGCGGLCLMWLGIGRAFVLGAIVGPGSNLLYSLMAQSNGSLPVFATTLMVENFCDGIAETALVGFMTRMCAREHSLTHYALMYSVCAMTGKLLKGFSGLIVDNWTPHYGLFGAYQLFFLMTASLALPTIILCFWLWRTGIIDFKSNASV